MSQYSGSPIKGSIASTTAITASGIQPALNRGMVTLMFLLSAEYAFWPHRQYHQHYDVKNEHLFGGTQEIATEGLS